MVESVSSGVVEIERILNQLRALGTLVYSAAVAVPSAPWGMKPDWEGSGKLIAEKAEQGLEIIDRLLNEEESGKPDEQTQKP